MTTTQENPKKNNKKSQISISYKTDASRKSISHKEKIVNAIKKSTLKNIHQSKSRKSTKSRNSISNTDPKKKLPPYQIQSQRNRTKRTMSSISRSVPLKNLKQKISEFPFEAIKFKNHTNEEKNNQNKTHDQFYIRYDQPELGQVDMKLLENSKKITGSYNQRIGRFSQQKTKHKGQYLSGVKNVEFRQNVLKLFKFLDPLGNRVISHSQIDYRKVPQAVLYFLGGLFQQIRQNRLYLSQKEFQQKCDQIYLKSSNDDVDWFIEQVKILGEAAQQRPKQINQKIVIRNAHTECTKKNEESRLEEKIDGLKPNFHQSSLNFNNLSFQQESSVISFRKESKESPVVFEGRQSKANLNPSKKDSQKSAQFGQSIQHHRFSFNENQRISFGIDNDKDRSSISFKPDSIIEETISLAELEQMEMKNQQNRAGVNKNPVQKVEDMREQIYAKLDKLKINPIIKDNNIVTQNFKKNSGRDTIELSSMRDNQTQNINSKTAKEYRYSGNFNQQNKTLERNNTKKQEDVTLKQPLLPKKQLNQIVYQKDSKIASLKEQKENFKQGQLKQSGWSNKAYNCDKTFDQLQKIRNQFNKHKNTIQYRQLQRQNYFKEESNKKPDGKIYTNHQELFAYQQTRVLKLSKNRSPHQKVLTKENKQNPCYQRNIDRLSNLSNSRDRNPLSINLNETLANSCRKSVEITLPLKTQIGKGINYSEKKSAMSSKIDKIDELSSKLQQYLMKNAEKIQYSKNFTEKSCPDHKFNRFLAL